ncbi:putative disease resistance protein RGA3 [Hevea brasiliensis]|uniref:putative disease resistance protein RGA3 n=1 Tax=Hevea brasiliensis TaxID=3981 RepID=UPI0025FA2B76|nr:putative disease resistance protein RGA3 [Hevea brasiliensis]
MAGQIPFSILEQVLTKLGSLAFQEIGLVCCARDDLKKLGNSLSTVKAVLVDAEEKQEQSDAVRIWIGRLQDIVYEAEELVDEMATHDLRGMVQGQRKVATQVLDFFSSSNQIWFRLKVGHRIKDIREKLKEVENEISSLNLEKKIIIDVRDKSSGRETSSVLKPDIIGREKDKEKMTLSLLNPTSSQGSVSVNAIVGIGGLGKTALAQLVYNDGKVKNYFEKKMWVCVSEEFEVKLLVKKILGSATNSEVLNLELEELHIRLKGNLEGKRYLLVLDDVWNEDQKKWDDLKAYLLVGAPGSKILVTTRSTRVASVMGVDSPYVLQALADNEAWDLFEKLAFGEWGGGVNPNLIKIGREMVKKCKGVPLAIRSLGSLMRLKTKESEWSSILESDLLKSFQTNGNVLSVLKLSYYHLPTYLRQCFTYCAMFSKDYEFDKETLIRLWIAQGYIVCSSKDDDLEDIGDQYFNELSSRSFFHQSESMNGYKMHDLIHDLAQSMAKDRYFAVENVCEGIHHVYWPCSLNEIEMLVKVKGMRTLFFESFPESVTFKKGTNFQRLRALHLGWNIKGVPNSIARLKYLRYLDISRCKMETLPKSINNLQNLQTLILSYCRRLRELPRDIEKLISLRCLMINGCESLRCMPIGLGKLTCLRQLSDFVVAWDEGSKGAMLNELNSLNQLKGRIVLHDLINVENVEIESNQVNLREKKHLQCLVLRWNYSFLYEETRVEKNELFLEKLEPHPNLQSLVVESFMGVRFSSWLSSITNLVEIKLFHCRKLKQLPPLHQLPSLKTLCLEELVSLEYVSDEEPSFLASPSITLFPSLQEIEFMNCYNLRGWWRQERRSGVELAQFPCLSKMQIEDCPKLIVDDGEVIEWGSFRSLQSLSIRFLSELKSLPKGLQFATNLQELIINHCDSLMALPDWIGNLTSLQRLEISYCPDLRSLPEGMHLLTSLQKLKIEGCRELSARCTKEKGVDWPKIAHIPNLEIEPPGF